MRELSSRAKNSRERYFPKFTPGKTSTADYVSEFMRMNSLRHDGTANALTHPSPIPEGPEIEEEFASLV